MWDYLFDLNPNNSVVKHLNDFNTLTSQLESVKINFDYKIRVLVLLSSMPETWDGLIVAVRNSCGTETLKFDDATDVLLSKEARKKSTGSAMTSGRALSVNGRGRSTNREKEKNGKFKSKSERGNFKPMGAGC